MILLLDTSTPVCNVTLVINEKKHNYEWQADRNLAKGLLSFLRDTLQKQNADFSDIQAIGVFRGPGSFTGLRIGLTVANTLADSLGIPIAGEIGDDWQSKVQTKLATTSDGIVLPLYSSDAHITKPRK